MQTQLNNIQLSPKSRANVREHAALLLVSCCRTNEACINEDICSNAGGEVRGGDGQKMEMLSKEDRASRVLIHDWVSVFIVRIKSEAEHI